MAAKVYKVIPQSLLVKSRRKLTIEKKKEVENNPNDILKSNGYFQ